MTSVHPTRIVAASRSRLTATFYDTAGVGIVPEAVTVDVTGRVGGLLVDGAVAAVEGSTAALELDGTEVVDTDVLQVEWTVTVGPVELTFTTDVEAAGRTLVPLGPLVAELPSMPAVDVAAAIVETEDRIEKATGWHWVDRLRTVTLPPSRGGRQQVRIRHVPVGEIVSAVDPDGNTVPLQLHDPDTGVVAYDSHEPVTVTLRTRPVDVPHDLAREAARAARHVALTSDLRGRDRRSQANLGDGDGARAFPMQTASLKHGRPFGVDGIDTVIMSHDRRAVLA